MSTQNLALLNDSARMLVIDDEEVFHHLIRKIFRDSSMEIHFAKCVEVARNFMERFRYDVVLQDVMLPEMDGMSFIVKTLKKHPHLSGKVIMCTGDCENAHVRNFSRDRGFEFLPKPVSDDDLRMKIKDILSPETSV